MTSFKNQSLLMANISQSAKNIKSKVKELESGKLNQDGLNDLIKDCSELLEQLYILRYKAYEEAVSGKTASEPKGAFKLDLGANKIENQISLIDAIEEAQKERESAKSEQIEAPAFEMNLSETVVEEDKKEETESEKVEESKSEIKEAVEVSSPVGNDSLSINEKMQAAGNAPSLGERLQQSAIENLNSAIGLNQKFLFINELFDENTDEYLSAVERLNSKNNLPEAMEIVNTELVDKYKWNMDDKVVNEFLNLIQRRYL